jgi:hypothetical protein
MQTGYRVDVERRNTPLPTYGWVDDIYPPSGDRRRALRRDHYKLALRSTQRMSGAGKTSWP